jgi:hypothetical protein
MKRNFTLNPATGADSARAPACACRNHNMTARNRAQNGAKPEVI